jgi:energy-converting hydrogenase Eha subunit A
MSLKDFLSDAVEGTLVVAAGITALPVMGAIGTITTAGVIVATVAGTTAAAIDHAADED